MELSDCIGCGRKFDPFREACNDCTRTLWTPKKMQWAAFLEALDHHMDTVIRSGSTDVEGSMTSYIADHLGYLSDRQLLLLAGEAPEEINFTEPSELDDIGKYSPIDHIEGKIREYLEERLTEKLEGKK